jgi:hypothetical protein
MYLFIYLFTLFIYFDSVSISYWLPSRQRLLRPFLKPAQISHHYFGYCLPITQSVWALFSCSCCSLAAFTLLLVSVTLEASHWWQPVSPSPSAPLQLYSRQLQPVCQLFCSKSVNSSAATATVSATLLQPVCHVFFPLPSFQNHLALKIWGKNQLNFTENMVNTEEMW